MRLRLSMAAFFKCLTLLLKDPLLNNGGLSCLLKEEMVVSRQINYACFKISLIYYIILYLFATNVVSRFGKYQRARTSSPPMASL